MEKKRRKNLTDYKIELLKYIRKKELYELYDLEVDLEKNGKMKLLEIIFFNIHYTMAVLEANKKMFNIPSWMGEELDYDEEFEKKLKLTKEERKLRESIFSYIKEKQIYNYCELILTLEEEKKENLLRLVVKDVYFVNVILNSFYKKNNKNKGK